MMSNSLVDPVTRNLRRRRALGGRASKDKEVICGWALNRISASLYLWIIGKEDKAKEQFEIGCKRLCRGHLTSLINRMDSVVLHVINKHGITNKESALIIAPLITERARNIAARILESME